MPWARSVRAGSLAALAALMAAGQTPSSRPFEFGPADLELLDQANQLDRQFDKKGLVYHDPEADAILDRLGHALVSNEPAPEHVDFQFHILRDPMVNAFALPNGSIYVNPV